jgi:uncharacterized protein YcfJ
VARKECSRVKAMQTADTEDTTPTGCRKITVQHTGSRSRHSVVGTVTRPWAGGPGNHTLIPGRGKRVTASTNRPDSLWGQPRLLFKEHCGLFRLRG